MPASLRVRYTDPDLRSQRISELQESIRAQQIELRTLREEDLRCSLCSPDENSGPSESDAQVICTRVITSNWGDELDHWSNGQDYEKKLIFTFLVRTTPTSEPTTVHIGIRYANWGHKCGTRSFEYETIISTFETITKIEEGYGDYFIKDDWFDLPTEKFDALMKKVKDSFEEDGRAVVECLKIISGESHMLELE